MYIPDPKEELEWIQRSIHGEHEAFRSLVVSYEAQLMTYLFHLLSDWENARDIAQETFVAAFYALPRWKHIQRVSASHDGEVEEVAVSRNSNKREQRPLAPWLYRIATNRAFTFLKKQSTRASFFEQRDGHVQFEQRGMSLDRFESRMTPEDQFVVQEALREALSSLSRDDAICLVLRFVLDEPYSEIAVQLGISKEAVRKRISRGLVALRLAYRTLDMEDLI